MNWPERNKVLALCGGVGGAKLALGLTRVLEAGQLTIVVNTGDDFEHFGLTVCPDLDTVMYTLAGLCNPDTGWGRKDESWRCLETLGELGAATWFQLGDRDLGVHLARRELLDNGNTLSAATALIAKRLGVAHSIVPMSDAAVQTMIDTDDGEIAFQDYFVRHKCQPVVRGIRFTGMDDASISPAFRDALDDPDLAAILICPSNPFVSVAPICTLPEVEERMRRNKAPVVAVSPIVAGSAIKGPAAKMMQELGLELSALGVYRHYGDLLDGFVIDEQDRHLVDDFEVPGRLHCCNTVMRSLEDRIVLARECLDFTTRLAKTG